MNETCVADLDKIHSDPDPRIAFYKSTLFQLKKLQTNKNLTCIEKNSENLKKIFKPLKKHKNDCTKKATLHSVLCCKRYRS